AGVARPGWRGRGGAAAQPGGAGGAAGGGGAAWPLDVPRLPMIDEAVGGTLAHFGRIDVLVNNAGINVPRLALDVTEEDWDRVLDVNLKGAFFVAQAVARRALVPQGGGKVINVASQNGGTGFAP